MLVVYFFLFFKIFIEKIHIWNPPSVAASYRGTQIEYIIADIGDVPYGKSLIGKLVLANPINLCNIKDGFSLEKKVNDSYFLLVERGDCHFAIKALLA